MCPADLRVRSNRRLHATFVLAVAMTGLSNFATAASAGDDLGAGRELFNREWVANDARSPNGDGLGPVFNDSSCVACHNSGGAGGAGPNSKNVDILSAAPNGFGVMPMPAPRQATFIELSAQRLLGIEPPAQTQAPIPPPARVRPDRAPLIAFHPGFRTANSIVLHRFSTQPGYDNWRSGAIGFGQFGMGGDPDSEIGIQRMLAQNEQNMGQVQNSVGAFFVTRSQRNPTALFGAGALDSVSDEVLIEQAKQRYPEFPEIAGRVSRLKDGRIGKFGWKGQTPSLEDFVLTACAVELGLDVPNHAQGGMPSKPNEKAKGLDLTAEQCASLTSYVRSLPKPVRVNADLSQVKAGETLFAKVGCANCHTPKLGDVDDLYSDLLLHDMGQDLGDTGQYGVFVPESEDPIVEDPAPGGVAQNEVGQDGGTTPVQVQVEAQAEVAVADVTVPLPPQVATPFPQQAGMMGGGTVIVGGVQAFSPFGIAPNRPKDGPASRQEWRTPPLWGMRDSGPYMHDGRAATLERAIALHGGEAHGSTRKYFSLSHDDRQQLQAFLRSLAAPIDASEVASR